MQSTVSRHQICGDARTYLHTARNRLLCAAFSCASLSVWAPAFGELRLLAQRNNCILQHLLVWVGIRKEPPSHKLAQRRVLRPSNCNELLFLLRIDLYKGAGERRHGYNRPATKAHSQNTCGADPGALIAGSLGCARSLFGARRGMWVLLPLSLLSVPVHAGMARSSPPARTRIRREAR